LFREGYLAVDFFCALSGFVVASAYEDRLAAGMSLPRFFETRIIRLYPLLFLGTIIGAVKMIGQMATHDDLALSTGHFLIAIGSGLLVLPVPVGSIYLFPLNGPLWSLFLEIWVNILFAIILFRLDNKALIAVAILAAVTIARNAFLSGSANGGGEWATVYTDLARVLFSFSVGMLLFRCRARARRISVGKAVGALLALAALFLFHPSGTGAQILYDLACMFIIIPLFVFAGSRCRIGGRFAGMCSFLGDISYPLYIIHFPLLGMSWFLARRIHLDPIAFALTFTSAIVILAALIGRYYDQPIRGAIGGWARARRPILAARQ